MPLGMLGVFALAGPAVAAPSNCPQSGTLVTRTFSYNPAAPGPQSFTVPVGVQSITVTADGAQGGTANISNGGLGGEEQTTFTVTPGDPVEVLVAAKAEPSLAPITVDFNEYRDTK